MAHPIINFKTQTWFRGYSSDTEMFSGLPNVRFSYNLDKCSQKTFVVDNDYISPLSSKMSTNIPEAKDFEYPFAFTLPIIYEEFTFKTTSFINRQNTLRRMKMIQRFNAHTYFVGWQKGEYYDYAKN